MRAAQALDLAHLDDAALRGREMRRGGLGRRRDPAVRAALVDCQRAFARRPEGAVLDGRDIGTVDMPRRRREDLRHRHAGGARPPPLPGARERGEDVDATSRCWPTSAAATRATAAARGRASAAGAGRALARHQHFGYRAAFRAAVEIVDDRSAGEGLSRARSPSPLRRRTRWSLDIKRLNHGFRLPARAGPLTSGGPAMTSQGSRRRGSASKHKPAGAAGCSQPIQENTCPQPAA